MRYGDATRVSAGLIGTGMILDETEDTGIDHVHANFTQDTHGPSPRKILLKGNLLRTHVLHLTSNQTAHPLIFVTASLHYS